MLGQRGLDHSVAEIEDERPVRQCPQNPDGRIPQGLTARHQHDRVEVALNQQLRLKLGAAQAGGTVVSRPRAETPEISVYSLYISPAPRGNRSPEHGGASP